MFKFTNQAPTGVPAGAYSAKFEGIEPVPAIRDWKAGHKFIFLVTSGPHAGRRASRICGGDIPTQKNALGRILSGLKGGALSEGEGIDPNDFVGRSYTIMVTKPKEDGGTRVETVGPLMT